VTQNQYDENGNLTKESTVTRDAEGNVTGTEVKEVTYDDKGEPESTTITRTDSTGQISDQESFDEDGRLTYRYHTDGPWVSDGMTTSERYEYDEDGRVLSETHTMSGGIGGIDIETVTNYTYDAEGDLQERTTLTYDQLYTVSIDGQETPRTPTASSTEVFDEYGKLAEKTDIRYDHGQETSYERRVYDFIIPGGNPAGEWLYSNRTDPPVYISYLDAEPRGNI
jgi:hypothetical protein